MYEQINVMSCQVTHQITELKDIEHLKISSSFTPLQFGNVFPETVNSRQGQESFGINLPSVAVQF